MSCKNVGIPARNDLIAEPDDNDVLCGRGGSINSHPGNGRFRDLVEKRKRIYLTARFKREKRLIASSIVSEIRGLTPPGRFLTKEPKSGMWYDIGDEKARDKTSQALRENAPSIRAEIETEINHQRAEMTREEEDESSSRANSQSAAAPPSPYYSAHPWGAGHYTPVYGYYPPASAPPPNYPPPGPYQPWEGHFVYGYSSPDQECPTHQAGMQPNEPRQRPSAQESLSHPHTHSYHREQNRHGDIKTTFDSLPSFISSVPSSIATWTRNSLSFGAHSNGSSDQGDYVPPESRPLAYVHRAEGQRQRVTFREDYHRAQESAHRYHRSKQSTSQYRNGYSSYRTRGHRTSHRKPQTKRPERDFQPMFDDLDDDDDRNNSLLSQVASHIIGSWDTPIPCAVGSKDDLAIQAVNHAGMDEGQEVELVEMMSFEDPIIEEEDDIREDETHSMPPPENRYVEIDWPSRVGGCHSWLPEASSFFSGIHDNPLSPSASADMDHSAVYSCAGSIGGASLCQVFAHDAIHDSPGTPQLDHKSLNQIPSWERSFRSRSPSACSEMSRDSSLRSMGSDLGIKPMGSADSGNLHLNRSRSMSPRNSISQNLELFEGRIRE